MKAMLNDTHQRKHTYLRISLTDNCNLRCFYCMPAADYTFMPSAKLMQPNEILELAKIFVNEGITKIRLTGGEPLVRKDAPKIIELLSSLPATLTITTNGVRVHEFIESFKAAGISSVNISLDTLQKEKFQQLTRRDEFKRVKANIDALLQHNFKVKVNAVVVKGVNDNELLDFVAWTQHTPIDVRFIEFMPFDGNQWKSDKLVTWAQMLETIQKKHTTISIQNDVHDTSKQYRIENYAGTFAVISTMSAPFCEGCNRIRLTADGKMKNCLFAEQETDLLTPLRNHQDVLPLIRQNLLTKHKALGGQFSKQFNLIDANSLHNRSMIAIGG
ncbi:MULTISPECIES: GTP 3',8-cyclase MoaA [Hydrotalea]|uniref:GTP 3',8-cyclase MoaA n=1 Tax=Hydrotalea TaxID=1004300 RepID=UPI001E407F0A|nr:MULTISPECIES: GTP 3',8-cyclase MoaA [Hydrotalea]